MPSKKQDKPPPSHNIFSEIISMLKSIWEYRTQSDPLHFSIRELQKRSKHIPLDEKALLSNFLQFSSKTVEDVMIPRSDICAISLTATAAELSQVIIQDGHTRTLVYQDTLDSIVGFVHIKDLFKIIVSKRAFNLKKLMRKPIIAAPSMKLIDLLAEMQKLRTHIAVIVDEYGGTDGIATIEDIMEAIVGKIEDEHDEEKDNRDFHIISEKEIITHARVKIEELEKVLSIQLRYPEDDCDTIGGLMLERVGHVPKRGTLIELQPNIIAEIVEASPRALKKVRIMIT